MDEKEVGEGKREERRRDEKKRKEIKWTGKINEKRKRSQGFI
jgi:hypothetical protein